MSRSKGNEPLAEFYAENDDDVVEMDEESPFGVSTPAAPEATRKGNPSSLQSKNQAKSARPAITTVKMDGVLVERQRG